MVDLLNCLSPLLKFVNTTSNLLFLLSKNRFTNRIILFNNLNLTTNLVFTKLVVVFMNFNLRFCLENKNYIIEMSYYLDET